MMKKLTILFHSQGVVKIITIYASLAKVSWDKCWD